jgi:hypothetical protein
VLVAIESYAAQQLSELTVNEVSRWSPAAINELGVKAANLSMAVLASLDTPQTRAISPEAMASLGLEKIAALMPSQVGQLLPDQVNAMSAMQILTLGKNISNLTNLVVKGIQPEKLGGNILEYFNDSQLIVLSLNQLRNISIEQFSKLDGGHKMVLDPDQLAVFGYCKNHCDLHGVTFCKDSQA